MSAVRVDLCATARGRGWLFGLLYLAEGAPIGFVWWTLPVALRRAGLDPAAIGGLLALLVLPWSLKLLWAPLVDVLRGPRFGLRGWIATAQVLMLATLLPLAWLDPLRSTGLLTALLLMHALAAATQDVAIDALAIAATPEHERGALNGWMQVGMLTGRGLFGGGALLARERLGDSAVVLALCGFLAASLGLHLVYRTQEPGGSERLAWRLRARAFGHLLRSVLRRRATWVGLSFAALFGAAFEAVGAMAGPFLVDRGLDDASVGLFFALPAALGLAGGALLGGELSDRLGRRPVVGLAGLAVAAATVTFALLDEGWGSWCALTAVFLGAGVLTASSYALLMDLSDPRIGSTQFSAYMGATNLCESWSARLSGTLAVTRGYPTAFLVAAALSLLALPLLALLPRRQRPLEDS